MVKIPTAKDHRQNAMFKKEFLEGYSLYKWYTLKNTSRVDFLKYSPSLMQFCKTCQSEQTFTFKDYDHNNWMDLAARSGNLDYSNRSIKINYECKGCHEHPMTFTILFSADGKKIQKTGQFPAISIQPTREIQIFFRGICRSL